MSTGKLIRLKYFALSFAAALMVLSVIFLPIALKITPTRPKPTPAPISSTTAVNYTPAAEDCFTTLFVVIEGKKAQYFILLRTDPVNNRVPVSSLPFGTQVEYEGKKDTLQGMYTYGGTIMAQKAIENTIGVRIDRTATMDSASFIKVLNVLGTVRYDLPYSLNHKDLVHSIYINIPRGKQDLDGRAIYDMFRFPTYKEGVEHRYKVQTDILTKLIDQRFNSWLIDNSESVFKSLINEVQTDFSYSDMERLLPSAKYLVQKNEKAVPVFVEGEFTKNGFAITEQSVQTIKMYFRVGSSES